jgi:type II secretory pathway pseudopilin PulG
MLNNQKGFSLFSIVAAIVVMGFLASVAVTKMSSGISDVQESASMLAAARALNSLEGQAYPAWILNNNGIVGADSDFYNWMVSEYPATFNVGGQTDLGSHYLWTAVSNTGGTLQFLDKPESDPTAVMLYTGTFTRAAGNRSAGRWTVD